MRKLFIFFLFLPHIGYSQDFKNAFKVSVSAAATKIYAVQHEYRFTDHLSFNHTLFYRPKSGIPFGTQLDKLAKSRGLGITGVDFKYIYVNEAKIGVKGYSPELRYYFGKKRSKAFLGGFAQFERYDTDLPAQLSVQYQSNIVEIKAPVNFDIRTFSGGILIGKQFWFGNKVSLDFVLFGPHFGKASKVYAKVQDSLLERLNSMDQDYLKNKVIERFRLSETYYDVSVAGDKAEIINKQRVPYLGIRGGGLNLGINF